MKIETKFNCGDVVFSVNNNMVRSWKVCEFCGGDGEIIGSNKKTRCCPECYRKGGNYEWLSEGWHVGDMLTIGQVRTEFTGTWDGSSDLWSNYGPQRKRYKEDYISRETGIGSGSVHKVEKLFSTKVEAQKECDRFNGEHNDEENQ